MSVFLAEPGGFAALFDDKLRMLSQRHFTKIREYFFLMIIIEQPYINFE
jgi:hypothetical protein